MTNISPTPDPGSVNAPAAPRRAAVANPTVQPLNPYFNALMIFAILGVVIGLVMVGANGSSFANPGLLAFGFMIFGAGFLSLLFALLLGGIRWKGKG